MVFALRKVLQKKKRLETFSDSRNGSLHPKTKKKKQKKGGCVQPVYGGDQDKLI